MGAGNAAFVLPTYQWKPRSLFRRGYLDALGLPPEVRPGRAQLLLIRSRLCFVSLNEWNAIQTPFPPPIYTQTLALLAALAGVRDDHSETPSPRATPSASPLAHRCYHLRAAVMSEALRRTWAWSSGSAVVVLGAGMDGLALASLARALGHVDESAGNRTGGAKRLIEVDCPEVVAKKQAALQRLDAAAAPAASSWLGPLVDGQHRCYHLVAADLRDPEGSVARALAPLFSGEEEGKGEVLFVLEAVLGYLPPGRATALLR